ncbi:hypothetical protein F5878DRAFT_660803 [Lentinula raphanica]|uniref:Non-ribosomal peptide synthetase n=1 Tax=Lentinula raphanica TaxID=153919 RepID=A0AA38P9P3_9AGAR|nr:hypothetical protein F5878DRAFT_660803 [Lentinula raphanica]
MTSPAHSADEAEKGILEHVSSLATLDTLSSGGSVKDVSHKVLERVPSETSTLQAHSPDPGSSKEVVISKPPPPPSPPKPARRKVSKWILFQLWFNTYRKFYTLTVTLNVVGLVLAATGVWNYPRHYTSAFILGNLQTALLVRNELFGRFLYLFVNTLFAKWTPLPFRLACTSVLQHLGGIHSGCATSGFMWLIFRVVINFLNHKNTHDAVLAMGVATNLAIAISILSAFPWVRNTHHNVFERHHRFIGWLGLICTWVFIVLGDTYDFDTHTWNPNGVHLIKQQDFWFAVMMTFLILWPWLTIRSVKVDVEIPSPKVAVLRFERGMQQGLLARISRSSIMEYHAFGTISEGVNAKHHYLICGVQGDFTKGLIKNPPTHIWTRQLKFAGVSNTSTLYKRGIRVCTGTGLGAALSTCLQSPNWYLIWIGSDQEKTFGPTIAGLIHDNLEGRVTLWDSKQRGGRPDTMQLIKEVYESWNAEIVFITSNWIGNKEMMEGCKEAGIPAFGTLWDF